MWQGPVVRVASHVHGADVVADDGRLCDHFRGAGRLVGRTESARDPRNGDDGAVFYSAIWCDDATGADASQSAAVQLGPLAGGEFGAYFGE